MVPKCHFLFVGVSKTGEVVGLQDSLNMLTVLIIICLGKTNEYCFSIQVALAEVSVVPWVAPVLR
jgi:hypothetical protein